VTDYYAVLGVSPDADEAALKAQYRKLAKAYHPDLHPGDKTAEERFKLINEAWEVLGSKESRAQYDSGRQSKKPEAKPWASRREEARATMTEADYANLMGKFDAFFGKAAAPKPGQNERNPLDGSELFERYMGIKKK
jgi:curved DNA-binding protein CbpA